jgi:hypothetical protein
MRITVVKKAWKYQVVQLDPYFSTSLRFPTLKFHMIPTLKGPSAPNLPLLM